MLLTIVVAAYNMHDYLPRCLDSLCVEAVMDEVQVIIVNDGSTDDTSRIAHQYAERYPHYFTVIDKENGNYGSCMNAALPIAKGKYFRTLDADDWYDSEAYAKFVEKLPGLDTDLIQTPRTVVFFDNKKEKDRYLDKTDIFQVMSVTYRTELLRKANMRWSEDVYYSDHEYLLLPLQYVAKREYIDYPVYCYAIGREGQSVSWDSTMKNLYSRFVVTERLLKHYLQISSIVNVYREWYLDVLKRLLTNVYATLYVDGFKHETIVRSIESLVMKSPDLICLTEELNDFHYYKGGYYVKAYRRNKFLIWYYYLCYHIKMHPLVRPLIDYLKRL